MILLPFISREKIFQACLGAQYNDIYGGQSKKPFYLKKKFDSKEGNSSYIVCPLWQYNSITNAA